MIHNSSKKGFTLIELLVVIAIIGILAGIVLTSLSTARTKAQDAQVISQLGQMRSAAEIYYSGTGGGTYGVVANTCSTGSSLFLDDTTGMGKLITSTLAIAIAANVDCGVLAGGSAWSVAAKLPGGLWYCVDSTGVSRGSTAAGAAYTALTGAASAAHISAGGSACN